MVVVHLPTRVTLGRTELVVSKENEVAGTYTYVVGVDCDSVRTSLEVTTVNSGTLDVSAVTYSGEYTATQVANLLTFPTVSAPVDLILKQGSATMEWVQFTIVHDGTCSYKIYLKGISAGETSVSISSPSEASASSAAAGTTPTLLIPSALADRSGLILKNWTPNSILYLGYQASEANATDGYPLVYGESLGMDLASGVQIYGTGTVPVDVRIVQS